jgi:glycosyltransferase involved in cell wall biosynthesis
MVHTARSTGGVIDSVNPTGAIRTLAMLGNHVPRQCGIATFTTDLSEAIAGEYPELDCFVLAMNDVGKRHAYPSRVRFEIAESDLSSYQRAADFLNVNAVDAVSVQHEYGIFGGKAGSHVLALLRELRMPIVTTLHTILAEPNALQRGVMDELTKLSDRLVVMSENGAALLREVHRVPENKIDLIPHGIPNLPATRHSKDKLGVYGKSVLLTFGLLSPDKGIENVIDALPAILERYPDTIYIVLGATHPHVKERHGETYRLMLESRAKRLGVESSIIFHNRFVSHAELVEFLSATDIYITPYLKAEQITSGTLAYAVGSGKAVISTPYRYARELLADGRGVLVPWKDSTAIAEQVKDLLGDDAKRLALEARAAAYGRGMAWPVVARGYMKSLERARVEQRSRLRTAFQALTLAKRPADLPEINLQHVRLMTDDTGILQHATFSVPRYDDGYCLDDNARALLLVALIEDAGVEPGPAVRALGSRYLAFVNHAFDAARGRFRNFMSYGRQWTEEIGSEDSHGRALWALGTLVGRSSDPGRQSLGGLIFHEAIPAVLGFSSPRAWAYTLLGIDEYLLAFQREASGTLAEDAPARLAVVRGAPDVLQRAPLAGLDRLWCLSGTRPDESGGSPVPRVARLRSEVRRGLFRADRLERILRARWSEGRIRPATGRGVRDALGLPRGAPRDGRRHLGEPRAPAVRLVSRRESASAIAVRPDHGRLSRRTSRRSDKPESRS